MAVNTIELERPVRTSEVEATSEPPPLLDDGEHATTGTASFTHLTPRPIWPSQS